MQVRERRADGMATTVKRTCRQRGLEGALMAQAMSVGLWTGERGSRDDVRLTGPEHRERRTCVAVGLGMGQRVRRERRLKSQVEQLAARSIRGARDVCEHG